MAETLVFKTAQLGDLQAIQGSVSDILLWRNIRGAVSEAEIGHLQRSIEKGEVILALQGSGTVTSFQWLAIWKQWLEYLKKKFKKSPVFFFPIVLIVLFRIDWLCLV
jgi:hypothetical protein